jgi:hypothetical protein
MLCFFGISVRKLQAGKEIPMHKEDEMIHDPGERLPGEETPELTLSRQERRWYALGALKGALMIGAVYLIGLGVLIALMLGLWT